MKDHQLQAEGIIEAIAEENHRQVEKWGIQEHSYPEWMTILTEEVGELAQAVNVQHFMGNNRKPIFKEAIQVATLALKIAEGSLYDDK